MIETLLRNKKNKYDLYYFDYTYTPILGSYLLDLNDRIPNNLLKIFNSNVLLNECSIEDKLVGLVLYIYIYIYIYIFISIFKNILTGLLIFIIFIIFFFFFFFFFIFLIIELY